MAPPSRLRPGFSLIELVIVVVIIGVIGAIAVPRTSSCAERSAESSLTADLSTLRRAIERYRAEHGGDHPTDVATIVAQLTQYTDAQGNTSTIKTATKRYGPYLRSIPAIRLGKNKGSNAIRDNGIPGAGNQGWFYRPATGEFYANTHDTELDSRGVRYNSY
jgi:prepilin-type N-terminal cleavage/methylation domain-containing protein